MKNYTSGIHLMDTLFIYSYSIKPVIAPLSRVDRHNKSRLCIITDGGKVVYYGQENEHSAVG